FVLTTTGTITVGTTALTFTQFSGAGEITAGTGLSKSGNTLSLTTPVAVANGGTGATSAGATAANNIGALAIASNLSDLASASTAKTNLGLGTMPSQNASSAAITGGTIDGTTIGGTTAAPGTFTTLAATSATLTNPLSVANGGTGASAAGATAANNIGALA